MTWRFDHPLVRSSPPFDHLPPTEQNCAAAARGGRAMSEWLGAPAPAAGLSLSLGGARSRRRPLCPASSARPLTANSLLLCHQPTRHRYTTLKEMCRLCGQKLAGRLCTTRQNCQVLVPIKSRKVIIHTCRLPRVHNTFRPAFGAVATELMLQTVADRKLKKMNPFKIKKSNSHHR